MWNYFVILAISFIVTVIATPILRRIALKIKIVDQPDEHLKIHSIGTPYLGGLAIFTGIILSLVFARFHFNINKKISFPVEIAIFLIMFLGLSDDIYDIKQNHKFILQILISTFLVICGLQIGTFPFKYIAIPLSFFYILGACNAVNLLDGLDGLASGNTAISTIFFFILFLIKRDNFGLILSLSLFGACSAFLIYNFNPAKIFMGDAGSMLLGLILSVLMIHYSSRPYDFIGFISAILICGIPIFDTALTYLRRYLNNRPIFPGDRSHFYDQLIDKGFTIKQTVLTSYGLGILFGSTALLINYIPLILAILIVMALIGTVFITVLKMNMLKMPN